MSTLLFLLGGGALLIGGIWLLIVAFQESVVWGLLCLLVPIAGLIFAVLHWAEAKTPFLIQLAGLGLLILASVLAPTPSVG